MIVPGEHSTIWEDGQMAMVSCNGMSTDMILHGDEDEVKPCPLCGVKLQLVWNVFVKVVP